jgi:hypothetical protein
MGMHILRGFPIGTSEREVNDWNEKLASLNAKKDIKSSEKTVSNRLAHRTNADEWFRDPSEI